MGTKTKTKIGAAVACVALLSGCASMGGWRPTVDTYGDRNAEYLSRDEADCRALAQQASGAPREAVKGGVVGGLLGAATGAAIGAIAGSPGTGAAVGGAAGGLGGGTYKALDADHDYREAFRTCMRDRGHNVIN